MNKYADEDMRYTWSIDFVMKCIEDAKIELPGVCEAIGKHDKGEIMLSDDKFEKNADLLQKFVFQYVKNESHFKILTLFAQVRINLRSM